MTKDPIIRALVTARVKARRTQSEVARAAGINRPALCEAEAGKHGTTLATARLWAAALGLEMTLVEASRESPVHAGCRAEMESRWPGADVSAVEHELAESWRCPHGVDYFALSKISTEGPAATSPAAGPELGVHVSEEDLRRAIKDIDPAEFRRETLGQWPAEPTKGGTE